MVKSVEIPQDIIDSVIAAAGNDTSLLKECALVSSSFLLPSRKQLFSRITLESDQTCQGIHQLLAQNPVIQSFVRSISLDDLSTGHKSFEWMYGTSVLAILRLPFPCLEHFSIQLRNLWRYNSWGRLYLVSPWNWDSFSSELKDVLSNIVHLPTLKTLSLKSVPKVPITFFLQIVHLTTLELHSLSPKDFGDENSSSLTLMASHTVIDRCLWHIQADVAEKQGIKSSSKSIFLPFMCRLRFFQISFDLNLDDYYTLSVLMGSLYISLTSPATLEHLQFNISFCGDIDDFNSYADEFMTIYVTLKPGVIWTPLPPIRLVHNYNELTLILITPLVTTTIFIMENPTRTKSKRLSLMVYLHFARKAFSTPRSNICNGEDYGRDDWI